MPSSDELIVKLKKLSCIELSGPQAQEYLQGQVTIDVTKMDNDSARFGAHCDFKGKAWSIFTAFLNQDTYHLLVERAALDKSMSELKKYGVFSKVEINQSENDDFIFGVCGPANIAALTGLFENLTSDHLSVLSNEYGSAICINVSKPRYILALNSKGATQLNECFDNAAFSPEDKWDALDILDALPSITEETSNEFVPQMLNLQALSGIDFDKGCYMGQETVARTKFLGRNKRATYVLSAEIIDTSLQFSPGMALEKQAGDNWRSGGTVLKSATVDQHCVVLAVLANDTQVGDVLRLKALPAQQFEVQTLPYTLDEK